MKPLRNIFRILVGIVFIFSGFVKGVDPLGTVYRMDDYFLAFNVAWAMPLSIYLTILLVAMEFTIGISLLFNLWIKKAAWMLLPMMTFFTILTFFDAVYNLVPDCGCFGDAVKLTNVATFLKNLVLMALVIPIFIWRKKYRSALAARVDFVLVSLTFIIISMMSVWCVRHLPLIDFMAWKVGNRVNQAATLPVKFFVTYKNRATGEEKEFVSPNYPWNDSVWLSQWVFKSQRVVDPNKEQGMVLRVEDAAGNDYTASVLENPDYQFILVAYNLSSTHTDALHRLLPFYKKAMAEGYSFICLTTSLPEEIKKFRLSHGTAFDYYNSDDVVLKTMVRANPGLILLKDGIVIAKWNAKDVPDYYDVKSNYMKNN